MSGNTDKRSGIFQFPAKGRGRSPPLMIFMHKQPVKVPVVINIAKTDNFSVFNSHKRKVPQKPFVLGRQIPLFRRPRFTLPAAVIPPVDIMYGFVKKRCRFPAVRFFVFSDDHFSLHALRISEKNFSATDKKERRGKTAPFFHLHFPRLSQKRRTFTARPMKLRYTANAPRTASWLSRVRSESAIIRSISSPE